MERAAVAAVVTHSVLIVDDEERNVRLLQAYLQGEGFHTVSASHGAAALAAAVEHAPRLILLDAMMPGMNAFEVATAVSTIMNGDGRTQPGHFDPEVLAAFADSHARFDAIFTELAG